jgi:hypothetical protein
LLTTSRRTVSIEFSVTRLKVLLKVRKKRDCEF